MHPTALSSNPPALALLKGDVEDAVEHLPDPDAPGPLAAPATH
jgi:hypothetical protein